MRPAPPPVPASLAPPEPQAEPDPSEGGSYAAFLDAQLLGPAIDDPRLRSALIYSEARGWLDPNCRSETAQVALQLAKLAAGRWESIGATEPPTKRAWVRRKPVDPASRSRRH